MIQQSVENALRKAGSDRNVTTILTQVEVDPDDPGLSEPTKFIGHAIPENRALTLEREGHSVKLDSRGGYRRVVGSPTPVAIHEIELIRRLVNEGTIVIACGGGGIPVYRDATLGLEGVDAVVDKDLAASVLARDVGAELFLILTDIDAVYADWGKPEQRALETLTVTEATDLDRAGALGEGSMAPKVRAAVEYVRRTGGRSIITELSRGLDAVHGRAGTTIAR
jgi:carbamate kinase